MTTIENILNSAYTDGIEDLISAYSTPEGVEGIFLSPLGEVYDYSIGYDGSIEYQESRTDSEICGVS